MRRTHTKQRIRIDERALRDLIDVALAEDVGAGDVTTRALIDMRKRGRGRLLARENGVFAGAHVARALVKRFGYVLSLVRMLHDGSALRPGTVIAELRGPVAAMLTLERTLLNFTQKLSGIATATRRYVDAVAGTGVLILDTRKTAAGWRALSKYAVAAGGGTNHRAGLYDAVLIKDNHLAAAGLGAGAAVRLARAEAPHGMRIEVEVESVDAACDAALAGADIIMLDNMRPAAMRRAVSAVRRIRPRTVIEASGGISLRNVRAAARTGVDWISVGAITHSAHALDIALDIEAE